MAWLTPVLMLRRRRFYTLVRRIKPSEKHNEYIKDRGFTLVSDFNGSSFPAKYQCEKGHTHWREPRSYKNINCLECKLEKKRVNGVEKQRIKEYEKDRSLKEAISKVLCKNHWMKCIKEMPPSISKKLHRHL